MCKYNMSQFKALKSIVVHSGVFHADDVFTVAYTQMLRRYFGLSLLKVIRTFKVAEFMTIENGYLVADIGKGDFDHHFPDVEKKRRPDGVPYAAFGLVVKEFHEGFLNEDEYNILDRKLIEPTDYHDNSGNGNALSFAISIFNKNWDDEDPNNDPKFFEAVDVASTILEKFISNVRSFAKAQEIAKKQIIEGNAIYMDKYAPVNEFFADDPKVLYIGSPSLRGTYQIITVKDPCGVAKKLFPERIRGISYPDGVYDQDGLSFCHPSGFMASFKDKETAKRYIENLSKEDNESA